MYVCEGEHKSHHESRAMNTKVKMRFDFHVDNQQIEAQRAASASDRRSTQMHAHAYTCIHIYAHINSYQRTYFS